MLHGDMTDYGHATILGVLLGDYIYIYIPQVYSLRRSQVLIICEQLYFKPPFSLPFHI